MNASKIISCFIICHLWAKYFTSLSFAGKKNLSMTPISNPELALNNNVWRCHEVPFTSPQSMLYTIKSIYNAIYNQIVHLTGSVVRNSDLKYMPTTVSSNCVFSVYFPCPHWSYNSIAALTTIKDQWNWYQSKLASLLGDPLLMHWFKYEKTCWQKNYLVFRYNWNYYASKKSASK